ncbi:ATP-dependent zinc protease [Vibrio neptunius]|uniref:ATP-dependent zinc protease n=1 Tax=Vibrio neptunius TaxID=170651 RepID=A0ABS2ZXW6_9VIBR|nr:ATP-dependent zinc protease [Vibrio neptunius]MBN3492118.1 ATP-dependent zinc protease [Vibrio neptunius]MBN3514615.1 ATP-dependent zinc protease [Vibrio neptunius]MBN3549259.1 ATP-dependent zinc protease [Vibrio neptunius]MBN3576784.1 ATP-dependent zinc protease [Vibrio neptunius]MCH9870448.1 ATP-dependent zinc protease [Vibrio neptunius]
MFTKLTPVISIALLSGCTLTNSEQYHQETLAAIQSSETNLTQKLSFLEQKVSNQAEHIESLQAKVDLLDKELFKFKTEAMAEVKRNREPIVTPVPVKLASTPSQELVLGEIEKVSIDSIKQTFDSRIDTGAATSSLNAVDIEQFERNGKNWVRFHLSDGVTPLDDTNWIEAPIIRFVKIRQSTNDETERRAVVELWVRLGTIHEKTQFTLADRSQMTHPVLLGREFIRDIAVVDVSKKYVQKEVEQKQ